LLFVEATLAIVFAEYLPLGLRAVAIHVWYLGYLALLALLWVALMAGTFVAIGFPFALIHDAFVAGASGQRSARAEMAALIGYFAFFMMAAFSLPAWAPLVFCLAALAVNIVTIIIPSNPDVQIIWRYRRPEAKLRAIPWGWWVTWEFAFLTVAAV